MNSKEKAKKSNWFRNNRFKLIGVTFILGHCAYYSYQESIIQREAQIRQDREAAERKQFQLELKRRVKAEQQEWRNSALQKHQRNEVRLKNHSHSQDDTDIFNEFLGDFLEDPEDELSYPPEIFEDQIDEKEEDLIENRVYD